MIEWFMYIIAVGVVVGTRIHYKKKYYSIINNYDVNFSIEELSKLNKIAGIVFVFMIVTSIYFHNVDDMIIPMYMYIGMPIYSYANKFIVYSGGIYIRGREYSSKDILSYQVIKLSKTHIRFRILVYENNKKRYKSVPMKNEYKEEVVKALDELIYAKDANNIENEI